MTNNNNRIDNYFPLLFSPFYIFFLAPIIVFVYLLEHCLIFINMNPAKVSPALGRLNK